MQIIFVYWFCVLQPYHHSSFISSNNGLKESLGFSTYNIMSSANNDSFTSSILIWMQFTSFLNLFSPARTSSTELNKSDKIRHPCLAPDYRGKAFNFSLLSVILIVCQSYMTFIVLRYVPLYIYFVSIFYHKWLLNFLILFLHLMRWSYNFYASFC